MRHYGKSIFNLAMSMFWAKSGKTVIYMVPNREAAEQAEATIKEYLEGEAMKRIKVMIPRETKSNFIALGTGPL